MEILKCTKKIAVVGGGPAGVSCALLLNRYGINATVYEKRSIGGLIENAWLVENIPLFSPTSGEKIAQSLKEALKRNNIPVIYDEIKIIHDNKLVGANEVYHADLIVLATGTKAKRIEAFEVGENVVYEYRDLPSQAKKIAFYGGGDVAFDGAIRAYYEGKHAEIFVRGNSVRAVFSLIKKVNELGIKLHTNEEIMDVSKVDDKTLAIGTSKGLYNFDALMIAVGRKVNLPVVKFTSAPVHIIGDAAHVNYRQASIATGDGIKCAMEIIEHCTL